MKGQIDLTPLQAELQYGLNRRKQNQPIQGRNNLNIKTTPEYMRPIKGREEGIKIPGSPLMIHDKDSCSYASVVNYIKTHFNTSTLYKLEHESCGLKRLHKNLHSMEEQEVPMKIEPQVRGTPKRLKKVKLSTSPLLFNEGFGDICFLQTPAKEPSEESSSQRMEIESGSNKQFPFMKTQILQDKSNLEATEILSFKSEDYKDRAPSFGEFLNKSKRRSLLGGLNKQEKDQANKENQIEIEF